MNEKIFHPLKILYFSKQFPLPMDTGGKIRSGKILEGLKKHCHITLLCHFDCRNDAPYLDQIKMFCDEFHYVPWKEVRKYSVYFYARVLAHFFFKYPISVQNARSRTLELKIAELVHQKKFDLLICDFLQPALNFRHVMAYPTLLFQHNVESLLVKQHYEQATHVFMKFFWWVQWKKMARFERQMCQQFRAIVAVSEKDQCILEQDFGGTNVQSIPTGVDLRYFSPEDQASENNSLIYVGAMDWLPNEDAIMFFAEKIFPLIRPLIPDVTLTVVGRNPSDYLTRTIKNHPGIHIIGRVDDVRPYIRQKTVYIIPLRIGGGTRIKVYEAMAMGKAIVSTSVGTEGLPVEHGKQILLADQPQEFADSVIHLLRDPLVRWNLGKTAREFVETHCDWDKAVQQFAQVCRQAVHAHPRHLQVHEELH